MPTQRDVQQLIQSLTPSGVNNGNPNTAYNQPRLSTPPPIIGSDGQWYLNSINPAANQAPQQLGWTPWSAPANSLQPTQIQWPVMQQPATPAPGGSTTAPTPGGGVPVPNTPAPTGVVPVSPTQIFPSGGGGGGYFQENVGDAIEQGCVAIDQEIYGFISPEGIEVGDIMPTVNPHTFDMGEHVVSYSETKLMPCVIITTECGAELKCSKSAPLLLANGQPELAENLNVGDGIAVQVDGMFDYSVITAIEDVGHFSVQHITCGNQYFLAGNGNGKYILHHNIKVDLNGPRRSYQSMFEGGQPLTSFGGNVSSGPGTRGAMQAAGTWDAAHGGTMANPATAWGQSMMDSNQGPWMQAPASAPIGQGIIDAFGETDNPLEMYNAVASSLGKSSAPLSGNALGNITGGSVTSWNPNMGGIPTMPAAQAIEQAPSNMYGYQNKAPEANDTSSWLDRAANWFDNTVLNNFYDENTNSWNKGNIGLGVISALTGIPVDNATQMNGLHNLFTDGGAGSDYARTQTQQAYDRSDMAKREALVTNLAQQYDKTPQEVLQIIGRLP